MVGRCRGKKIYDKKGAISARNKRWREDRVPLRIYECLASCGGWHLTHEDPFREDYKYKKDRHWDKREWKKRKK